MLTPETLKVWGRYNWKNQSERLIYVGPRRYPGDSRRWHQFAKTDSKDIIWCEVLDSDLHRLEETKEDQDATRSP